jgi:hypothetical protein
MGNNELTRDLTGSVLSEIAPAEVLLLPSFQPDMDNTGKTAGGPQGIGVHVGIVLLLPYIYRFFEKFLDGAASRAGGASWDMLVRWLRESKESDSKIEEIVNNELEKIGVPEDRRPQASASIIRSLKQNKTKVLQVSGT